MSVSKLENPLTVSLLEAAAYLCLAAGATTDLSSRAAIREWRSCYQRQIRFEEAKRAVQEGLELLKLGLLSEDCAWAAEQANRAKDPDKWTEAFRSAEQALKEAEGAVNSC